jgi:hypothetical protein
MMVMVGRRRRGEAGMRDRIDLHGRGGADVLPRVVQKASFMYVGWLSTGWMGRIQRADTFYDPRVDIIQTTAAVACLVV